MTMTQNNRYDLLNLSDFYTQLIKEAARCESYSSDVLYTIDEIKARLAANEEGHFVLAFYMNGVDHEEYYLQRKKTPYYYFAVYSVDIQRDTRPGFADYLTVEMKRLDRD